MTNNNELHEPKPLTLHIRRLRQWHGETQLSQSVLAALAGVSSRHLRRYECATELPQTVLSLLRIAIALSVSFEELLDPDLLDELRADIEARRSERGLTNPSDSVEGDRDAF